MWLTCDLCVNHMQLTYKLHATRMWQLYCYVLLNPQKIVEGWRARLYFFTSGTLFKKINPPLLEWIMADKIRRVARLTKLFDPDEDSDMYRILADIMFYFIKFKKQPFPSAMLSQEDFWNVEGWKRAVIFVNLYRTTLDKHVTCKYHEWTEDDFTLQRSLFRRSVPLYTVACELHVNCMRVRCNSHVTGG